MFEKKFILDSEWTLVLGGKDYYLHKHGRVQYSGESALEETQKWIDAFKVRYPGYATKMQGHFNNFIGVV